MTNQVCLSYTSGVKTRLKYSFITNPVSLWHNKCTDKIVSLELWSRRYCKGNWSLEVLEDTQYSSIESIILSFDDPKDASYFKLIHVPTKEWKPLTNI